MKRIVLIISGLLGLILCQATPKDVRVIRKGAPEFTIVLSKDAKPADKTAAEQLSKYFGLICGNSPAVITDDSPSKSKEIILGTTLRDTPRIQTVRDTLGGEGYAILFEGKNIHVTGNGENFGRGTLYGAFEFLRLLGCEFYASDTETVPHSNNLSIPRIDKVVKPVFEYRDVYWSAVWDKEISTKLHRNGNLAGQLPPEWGGGVFYAGPHFVHTFEALVPPAEYFESHPEYFSEIEGTRTAKHLYSQLCMTNEDVFNIALGKVRQWLAEKPDAKIVSVSQNDSFVIGSYCTCETCKAIIDEEGSPMGPLLRFVNRIADSIKVTRPGVAVDLLAYQYSVTPPKHVKPRDNVIVRFCTGGCNGHTIRECPNNANTKSFIERWGEICDRIYIWDYTTNFAQYLCPFPNFYILKDNINFFKENGVKGVFEQGMYQGGVSGEFGELRAYVLSRLLWDPSLDTDELVNGFMGAYYGAGAKKVREYFDYMHKIIADSGRHFILVQNCADIFADLISDEDLKRLDNLWKEAINAAEGKDKDHVRAANLSWRFYKMMSKRGEWASEDNFKAEEDRFYKDCNDLGVTRLNEGVNIPWIS